jgi:D-lactate dehydrogenase
MNSEKLSVFKEKLGNKIPIDRIISQWENRLAYGTDASFYRLIPEIVLQLDSVDEVQFCIKLCRSLSIPYTFRAAGTSLSGQAVSDSVLITLTNKWQNHSIESNGNRINLQPGVIGAEANLYLKQYGRKIGPDPASINSCKIGGIAANNASGMCCGTAQNSYNTVHSMKLVLSDGTYVDTADDTSITSLKRTHGDLLNGIVDLAKTIELNPELKKKIEHKYRLKNTTGYALNALVDYQDPIDILTHLMIGSEGTLGFIAEITYNTVVDHACKSSSLVVFDSIEEASQAVTALSKVDIASAELMDGRALRSISQKPNLPHFVAKLDLEATALLIEVHASDSQELEHKETAANDVLANFNVSYCVEFTRDIKMVDTLWAIRKGMFPAVGAVREVGTTVIIEDVAFPIEILAAGIRDLQQLFEKYHYDEAIIFGHALEGNLHFVFTQAFDNQVEIDRYGSFMDEVTQLVAVKYGGSLKAEHGTGRNMAPFVELEWGQQGYKIVQKIKALFDPEGLLNPGVIVSDDKNAHLRNLKPMPAADDIIDRCIECGFCEPVCPSRDLSLTPRQRIVLYRELQHRRSSSPSEDHSELEKLYEYQGLDTCAATGLCADRCPVGINTGDLVKKLRQAKYKKFTCIAKWTAEHFSATTKMTKLGLTMQSGLAKVVGQSQLERITPMLNSHTPPANTFNLKKSIATQQPSSRKVIYFPSCGSRSFGQDSMRKDYRSLTEVTFNILTKAGYEVLIPKELNDLCCGMPYDSKGMPDIADSKAQQLEERLWEVSQHGELPILMDTSPCAKRSIENSKKPLSIYEPTQFILEHAKTFLDFKPLSEPVMLHVTCSSRRMGIADDMLKLASLCSNEVILPQNIECCGWAGDKGFTTPELNASALQSLKKQVPPNCSKGYSNSVTCEIGLSKHSGIDYQSILYLVDRASTGK